MIFDHVTRLATYRPLSSNLARAIDFLRSANCSALPVGRHDVSGLDVYVIVQTYDTKPAERARWESHRRYIDVQLMLDGSERMDVADVSMMRDAIAYDEAKDATFYGGVDEFLPLIVRPATFAIFFPHDAHRPTVAARDPATVRKVVAKVAV